VLHAFHCSCLWPRLLSMPPESGRPGKQGGGGGESLHKEKVKTKTGVPKASCNRMERTSHGRALTKKLILFSFLCLSLYCSGISGSFFGRRGGGTSEVSCLSVGFISCLSSSDFSTSRKYFQGLLNRYYFGIRNHGLETLQATQKAEEWGRSGKNPNHFRPEGLPEKF
jgi:hypothetical protein